MSTLSVTHSEKTTTVGKRAYYRGSLMCGVSFPVETHGYIVLAGEQYRPESEAEAEDPHKSEIEPFRSIQKDDAYRPWKYRKDGVFVAIQEWAPMTFRALVETACSIVEHFGCEEFWSIPQHRDLAIQACDQAYDIAKKRMADRNVESYRARLKAPVFAPIQVERSEVSLQREALIRALIDQKHLLVDAGCNMIRAQNEKAIEALGCVLYPLHTYRPRINREDDGTPQKLECDTYH